MKSEATPAQIEQRRKAREKGSRVTPWRSAPMVGSKTNWQRHKRMHGSEEQ
jgi:hypothetical protein